MEAQIIRYRATRRYVFGVLNVGDFECFVIERRKSMLAAGAYSVTLSDYNNVVRFGDIVATHDKFVTGAMHVGCYIKCDRLEEVEETGRALVKEFAMGLREGMVNLEIIDEADYDEADSELA